MAANSRQSKYPPQSCCSTSSSSASRSSQLLHRYSLDRRASAPNRLVSVSANRKSASISQTKRTCMCSPTNHPGSFRCSLHKKNDTRNKNFRTKSSGPNKLVRSAMANSLVRIGAVEGDLVKRALATLIRPSSHQLRRLQNFRRRPSRLSGMSREWASL